MRTLYRYHITDEAEENGSVRLRGYYEKVESLSDGLQRRLRENGLSLRQQRQLQPERKGGVDAYIQKERGSGE